jgi:hypothetical protein
MDAYRLRHIIERTCLPPLGLAAHRDTLRPSFARSFRAAVIIAILVAYWLMESRA